VTKHSKRRALKRWDVIIRLIPKNRPIIFVEVGVYLGQMARNLLARVPNLIWIGVDSWLVPEQGSEYVKSGALIAKLSQKEFDAAYDCVVKMAAGYKKRASVIRCDSVVGASFYKDRSVDFVFIDDDHSEYGCSRSLKAWLPKIKKGGIISGHDYGTNQGNVKKAVDELISGCKTGDDNTWWKVIN
jgi:hypothetical protein